MYKNLFYRETLEPTKSHDSFYTIKDLYEFVIGDNTKTRDYHHLKHKLNNFYNGYNSNVDYITATGLPSPNLNNLTFRTYINCIEKKYFGQVNQMKSSI